MYLYETHLHTSPASACARFSPADNVAFYKQMGYDGIFITNHFIDGNIGIAPDVPYEDKIRFYFADYDAAVKAGKEWNLKVFSGVEMSYLGTDFLVYGLDMDWYLKNPQIQHMPITQKLSFLRQSGALVIQAHPYREASYIDHIRLFPRHVDGVEIFNAGNQGKPNELAKFYAESYALMPTAGSDNHSASNQEILGGVECEKPLENVEDFITCFKAGLCKPFVKENPFL